MIKFIENKLYMMLASYHAKRMHTSLTYAREALDTMNWHIGRADNSYEKAAQYLKKMGIIEVIDF